MTMAQTMLSELQNGPGSARDLAARLGWTEKQARNAIDRIRRDNGQAAVERRRGGSFALPADAPADPIE